MARHTGASFTNCGRAPTILTHLKLERFRPASAGSMSGFGSLPGERAGDEESAGSQKRCAGEPMADEAAHLRAVAKFVPAVATDPQDADVLAAAQGSDRERGPAHSTDAEDADADEYPGGQCVERCERSDRTSDHSGHSGWRTQSAKAGGISGSPGEGQREGDRAKPGGKLARGSVVCAEAGTGRLRVLPEADGRV